MAETYEGLPADRESVAKIRRQADQAEALWRRLDATIVRPASPASLENAELSASLYEWPAYREDCGD